MEKELIKDVASKIEGKTRVEFARSNRHKFKTMDDIIAII